MKLHYNAIKSLIDNFFREDIAPQLNNEGSPEIEIIKLNDGEIIENMHYSRKAIDTKDQKKLAEFADRKLKEYLNPSPIFKEGEDAPSLYLSEISKANAINKELRTPKMFFELKINEAKEYQTYFPEHLLNAEHLKYHSRLEDWIECLQRQRIALQPQDQKGGSELTLEQIFDNKKDGYSICLELFKELQIVDRITGNKEITDGKGYLLFGLIDAIKTSNHNLLRKTFTDKKLLSIFNSHLQTNFKQLKRTSQGFKDAKKQSKDYINRLMK